MFEVKLAEVKKTEVLARKVYRLRRVGASQGRDEIVDCEVGCMRGGKQLNPSMQVRKTR